MEFRILGPLEVLEAGQQIDLGGAKQRGLLAMLLLHANEVVSQDRLIEAVWEEQPPETAQKALQVYVSRLRKTLGKKRLETKARGYLLRVAEGELDLERFQQLADEQPKEALALWRGEPLAEFSYQRFAQTEIARLEALRLACLERRLEEDLEHGRHAAVVGELERLVREHPLRERLRAQLMLALYRSGRQAEALEAYQAARRALTEELGIDPSAELRELQQAILRQDASLERPSTRAVVTEGETPRGVFVGREAELAALRTGFEAAAAGHGGLFLLVGEPGIGKSRLADELIRHAWAHRAEVLVGRCWEAGGAPAYWPWVQSIRTYIQEIEPELLRAQLGAGASDLAQLLPELQELFPDLPEPPQVESESARFRLFDAASSFLRAAARERPLVLVLDDLHAADEPSLLLLQFVARELEKSRILVLGAYRDVDPTPAGPLTIALAELLREPVTRTLVLAGLQKTDVARFVELVSGETASDDLVSTIHSETEGNPLFVGEIVRLLEAEGRLADPRAEPRLMIPQSVRDVIARRLGRLSQECNRVLVLASVLGREFSLDPLARAAGVSEDDLLETLDEAMAARVVSDVPANAGRLRFAHVLIRDTLYEGLTSARRVRLHRLVFEALEALYGKEPGQHLAELAHHAVAGSDFDKGLVYAQRAGRRALKLLAYEEAARLYETALDALELSRPDDEYARCELLLSLGEAEIRAGNSVVAKQTFLNAAVIARHLGLSSALARAAEGYGGRIVYARAGGDGQLVSLLEEGLDALNEDDVELRVRLLSRLAGALRDEHSRDRRDRLSGEAVALARRTENPAALAYALDGRAAAIVGPDTIAECVTLGSELREVGEQIGDMERVVMGHWHRWIAEGMVGDMRELDHDFTVGGRIAEALRQPAQLWGLYAGQAMWALAEGKLAEAEELMAKALSFGERAQPEMALPAYQVQRYTLCDFRGTVEEVEPAIRALVREYPARPVFRCLLAHLWARLGKMDDASRELEELAPEDFAALPFDVEWLLGMSLLAETSSLVADTGSAAILYRLLHPWAALNVTDHPEAVRGSVSRYTGLLAVVLENWDDAALQFENALTMNKTLRARPWLALTQEEYARMLLARADAGDTEKAESLLDAALATYRELRMTGPLARAEALSIPSQ